MGRTKIGRENLVYIIGSTYNLDISILSKRFDQLISRFINK
jgi:hypothetical protein